MNRKLFWFWLVIQIFAVGIAFASFIPDSAHATIPTPAPTSTYIQFRDPAPMGTQPPPLYVALPTPIPFFDMPIYYYHDEEHKVGCWVTANYMGISCLADPYEPPPCTERVSQ